VQNTWTREFDGEFRVREFDRSSVFRNLLMVNLDAFDAIPLPSTMKPLLLFCLLLLSILGTSINITSYTRDGDHLLLRFREEYQKFSTLVHEALANPPNVFLLEMLGEELDEFRYMVSEVRASPICPLFCVVIYSITLRTKLYLKDLNGSLFRMV